MTLRCPLKITVLAFAAALLAVPASAMQCAIYAREVTGFQLFGSAYSWWNQAAGKYGRGHRPVAGSILVFENSSRLYHGHVAVVRAVINDREILVDHSNWNVGRAKRGSVTRSVRVRDRSPGNDWSMVNVWLTGSSEYGTGDYPTAGFIYNAPAGNDDDEKFLTPSQRASKRNKSGTIAAKTRPLRGRNEIRAVEQRQTDRRTPEHILTARAELADKGGKPGKPMRNRDTLVAEAGPAQAKPETARTARHSGKTGAKTETVIAAAPKPETKGKPARTELLAQVAKPAKGKTAPTVQVAQAKPSKRSSGQNVSLLAQTGPTP